MYISFYSIQPYVVKFVSNLPTRSVTFSGFLQQRNWPPLYNWNIVDSDVKHHNTNPLCMKITVEWINHCCLKPSEQHFSHVVARTSFLLLWWWYIFYNVRLILMCDIQMARRNQHKNVVTIQLGQYLCILLSMKWNIWYMCFLFVFVLGNGKRRSNDETKWSNIIYAG